MTMNKEVLELLAPHGDQWCLDLSAAAKWLVKSPTKSKPAPLPRANGTVAIIPIHGVMTKRGLDGWSSYTPGTDAIGRTIEAAIRHKSISAIVLDFDTPGGSTYGLM
jgi:ClpP class serine protease